MTHVSHSTTIPTIPAGAGGFFARAGASLQRFGARMIEARQRQANAVVHEELKRLGLAEGKVVRHDADGNFL